MFAERLRRGTPTPPLVAVIEPVEPDLLRAFIAHYRDTVQVREFHLGFHFTEDAPASVREELISVCEELIGPPVVISRGPWHETVHSELRDHLRARAGAGWHVIADVDEFHDYPVPLTELIDAAENAGSPIVGGLLLDRVSEDGSMRPWSPEKGLDQSYPLGGYLTPGLMGGNPGKIVAAHSSVRLGLGSHRSLDEFPVNRPLVPGSWRTGDVGSPNPRPGSGARPGPGSGTRFPRCSATWSRGTTASTWPTSASACAPPLSVKSPKGGTRTP